MTLNSSPSTATDWKPRNRRRLEGFFWAVVAFSAMSISALACFFFYHDMDLSRRLHHPLRLHIVADIELLAFALGAPAAGVLAERLWKSAKWRAISIPLSVTIGVVLCLFGTLAIFWITKIALWFLHRQLS